MALRCFTGLITLVIFAGCGPSGADAFSGECGVQDSPITIDDTMSQHQCPGGSVRDDNTPICSLYRRHFNGEQVCIPTLQEGENAEGCSHCPKHFGTCVRSDGTIELTSYHENGFKRALTEFSGSEEWDTWCLTWWYSSGQKEEEWCGLRGIPAVEERSSRGWWDGNCQQSYQHGFPVSSTKPESCAYWTEDGSTAEWLDWCGCDGVCDHGVCNFYVVHPCDEWRR